MIQTSEGPYDLAVVGAGPVGLAMAGLSAKLGMTVALLDRDQRGVVKPRATHLDDESVRIFQAMGVADELESDFYVPPPFTLYDQNWNKVAHTTLSKEVGDQAWRHDYMFHQPTFELRMREILAAADGVSEYFGVEVTDVTQSSASAVVHARDLADDTVRAIEARFVVGCDGASSVVRRCIGSGLEDLHGTQRWVVIDLLINEGIDGVTDDFHSYATSGPGRTYTYVPTGERRRRVEFKALDDESDESLEDRSTAWGLVAPWVSPSTAVIERADAYEFNALIADRWRSGRLFIAGDAAHQMPPKAGQGLCSGLRDAANLAWKISMVVHGAAGPALLDTYQSERSPHVRVWTMISNHIAQAIEQIAAGGRPDIAGEQNPEQRPPLGPGLHGPGDPPAGLLSYQSFLPDGTRLDDRVGLNFAVIAESDVLDRCQPGTRTILDELDAVVLSASEADYEGWLSERHAAAVMIRPDRYVFGVATDASQLDVLTQSLASALAAETQTEGAARELA